MTASLSLKSFRAGSSVIAGVMGGVLSGWLTGSWPWGIACASLVLVGVIAGADALKTRRERRSEGQPAVTAYLDGNVSSGDAPAGEGSIIKNGTAAYIGQSRTTDFRRRSAAILAIFTLASAAGGTAYLSQQAGGISIESPLSLASEGSHNSPEAAVEGFLGNVLVGNVQGACSYVLPADQDTCSTDISGIVQVPIGSLGIGNAIINGTMALVPLVGKLCGPSGCQSFSGTGLPPGMSFQAAFQNAVSSASANLAPCEEIDGSWYADL